MASRDREFIAAVEEGAAALDRFLREQMIRRPYATMSVGALLGYASGGGLTIRTSALLLRAAARVATVRAVQRLMHALPEGQALNSNGTMTPDQEARNSAFGSLQQH